MNSTVNFTPKTDIILITKRWVRYRYFEWNLLCNSPVWQWFFSWTAWVLKENKHTLSERMEKVKNHFRVNCQYPANRNYAKKKRSFVSSRSKKCFTDVLYYTLSLKTRSFTYWGFSLKYARLTGKIIGKIRQCNQERTNFKQDPLQH